MGNGIRRIGLAALAALAGLAACGPALALELAARDAVTGAALEARVEFPQPDGPRHETIGGALREITAPPQRVRALARAPGYRSLAFTLDPETAAMTLLLDPVEAPDAETRLAAQAQASPNGRWLHGWVRRADDGAALVGAQVDFEGRTAYSDADGHFELALAPCGPEDRSRARLRVQAAGLATRIIDGVLCAPGVQSRVVALGTDAAHAQREQIGALDRLDGGAPAAVTGAEVTAAFIERRDTAPDGALVAPALTPPASIRVGFADAACTQTCCTSSCTHTCTYSLETYVRRGLNDEWISSWNQASLRAGSVAYRSYGAWRVEHPIRTTFDICSSACCQVNDPDTVTNTDAAVARTAGIMLMRGGAGPISSEYSAENNSWDDPNDGLSCSNTDLSCGDGSVGSPATGWPCLVDEVAAGRGCFGHGRGMSQWGTKRWGDAPHQRLWPQIVDHYYNASGAGSDLRTAVMSSPLSLQDASAQPSAPAAGGSVQILAQAGNLAGTAHAHLLIGASLYRSGVGYLDDPANDAPLTLAPGTQTISRDFQLPAGAPHGSYDLLVSLYLDVDENGAISSVDLPLALTTAPGAVQVGDGGIFEDGFETGP